MYYEYVCCIHLYVRGLCHFESISQAVSDKKSMPSLYLSHRSQYRPPITKLWLLLLRLPLNFAWELLQSALNGRNGLELALVFLTSAKLGFVCARAQKKTKVAKYFNRGKKFDMSF